MKWYPIGGWFPPIDFKEFQICFFPNTHTEVEQIPEAQWTDELRG